MSRRLTTYLQLCEGYRGRGSSESSGGIWRGAGDGEFRGRGGFRGDRRRPGDFRGRGGQGGDFRGRGGRGERGELSLIRLPWHPRLLYV